MALKMILDSLEGLSEDVASHYVKKGEKFELQAEGAKSQGDIDRLQKALQDERNISKELRAKLEPWGELNPDEVKLTLDKVPELEILAEKGNLKKDEKEIEVLVNARVKPIMDKLVKAETELKASRTLVEVFQAEKTRSTIHSAIRTLATESKANPEAYGSEFGGLMLLADKVFTVDGQGAVVVKDGIEGMSPGVNAKDVWSDIQKSHGYLWPSSSGGGAPGSSGGQVQSNPFKTNDMDARNNFALQHPDKVPAMVKAAGLQNAWDKVAG